MKWGRCIMSKTDSRRPIKVFQTAYATGDRLTRKDDAYFQADPEERENELVNIYEELTYQEIEGFGGAFTEAAATTYYKMSPEKRQEILDAYFTPGKGLEYSLCRTHINSCDFSTGNYAYAETDGDTELRNFDIGRDRKALVPLIKEAEKAKGGKFKLFASPWSPPAWMKTNGAMNRGGRLKDEYREVWARYFARYIKEYAKEGVEIWGVTIQNEPKAVQPWDSCIFTAEEERDFIRDHLGPELEKQGLGHIKIIFWDHNKERVYERSRVVLSDPEAAKYVWGIGFHMYSGSHLESLAATHETFPGYKLIATEGCVGKHEHKGWWETGEIYGHTILGDLNNWTVAWTDWNLLLDLRGGPNHVKNYCDAPVSGDTGADEIIYAVSYYYIGHFSKFIRPGAKRIGFSRFTDELEVTAFRNKGGEIAVVVMNRGEKELDYYLRTGHGVAGFKSLPHSIMTLVY